MTRHSTRLWLAVFCVGVLSLTTGTRTDDGYPANYVAGSLIRLNDNGAWSWFMDERAIVHDGKLIVGSVRAVGDFKNDAAPGWGNVELAVYDGYVQTVLGALGDGCSAGIADKSLTGCGCCRAERFDDGRSLVAHVVLVGGEHLGSLPSEQDDLGEDCCTFAHVQCSCS